MDEFGYTDLDQEDEDDSSSFFDENGALIDEDLTEFMREIEKGCEGIDVDLDPDDFEEPEDDDDNENL